MVNVKMRNPKYIRERKCIHPDTAYRIYKKYPVFRRVCDLADKKPEIIISIMEELKTVI